MTQLTIRGVDRRLHDALKQEADRRGLSINRYVLSLLLEASGMVNKVTAEPMEYHDLDHLAGTWTAQEYDEFESQLAVQRSPTNEGSLLLEAIQQPALSALAGKYAGSDFLSELEAEHRQAMSRDPALRD